MITFTKNIYNSSVARDEFYNKKDIKSGWMDFTYPGIFL